jgi:hypothetical protein
MNNIGDESIEKMRQAMAVLNEWADRTEAELAAPPADEPPTVTLHSYGVGLLTYVSITRIEEETNIGVCRVQGMRRCADGVRDERDYSRAVIVSAAEVTAKARAAWGAEWSCPGAEPSVVVLTLGWSRQQVRLSAITKLGPALGNDGSYVLGEDDDGNLFHDWVNEYVADIRAACALAGVPCCEEPTMTRHELLAQAYAAARKTLHETVDSIAEKADERLAAWRQRGNTDAQIVEILRQEILGAAFGLEADDD